MRLLLVNAVDHPGEPEVRLLQVAERLRELGWATTVTSPGEGAIGHAGFPWIKLDIGGPGHGEGARAVASWPRALRLAQRFDAVYLNSTVCGRLLPALRGTRTILHVHVPVDRIPRHWYRADVVIADGHGRGRAPRRPARSRPGAAAGGRRRGARPLRARARAAPAPLPGDARALAPDPV